MDSGADAERRKGLGAQPPGRRPRNEGTLVGRDRPRTVLAAAPVRSGQAVTGRDESGTNSPLCFQLSHALSSFRKSAHRFCYRA